MKYPNVPQDILDYGRLEYIIFIQSTFNNSGKKKAEKFINMYRYKIMVAKENKHLY